MEAALARRGDRFAHRWLLASEFEEFRQARYPANYLAKRFAAREAAVKALGCGFRDGMRWRDIGVQRGIAGQPGLVLAGRAQVVFERLGATRAWLSLSDEREFAQAFVILER